MTDLFFNALIEGYFANPCSIRRDWLAHEVEKNIHESNCHFVLLTDDGRYLVSAGMDRTIRVWLTETWEQLASVTVDSIPTCLQLIQDSNEGSPPELKAIVGHKPGRVYCFQNVIPDAAQDSSRKECGNRLCDFGSSVAYNVLEVS